MAQDAAEIPSSYENEQRTQRDGTTTQSDVPEDTFKDPKVISLNATVGSVSLSMLTMT